MAGLSTEHDLPRFVTAVLTCRLVPVRVLVKMDVDGVALLSSSQEREEVPEREDLRVSFPPEVQAAIEAVLPSSDPLDQVSKGKGGHKDLDLNLFSLTWMWCSTSTSFSPQSSLLQVLMTPWQTSPARLVNM